MIALLIHGFSIHEDLDFKRWYNKAEQGSILNCGLPIADCGIWVFKKVRNLQSPIRNGERGLAMAVITVSRQLGSLGTEIAQKPAEVLQYEFVDKEKVAKALGTYGLPQPDLERFDEKKPPFWDSLQVQRRKFLHFL
jgi:hypothetical protein